MEENSVYEKLLERNSEISEKRIKAFNLENDLYREKDELCKLFQKEFENIFLGKYIRYSSYGEHDDRDTYVYVTRNFISLTNIPNLAGICTLKGLTLSVRNIETTSDGRIEIASRQDLNVKFSSLPDLLEKLEENVLEISKDEFYTKLNQIKNSLLDLVCKWSKDFAIDAHDC